MKLYGIHSFSKDEPELKHNEVVLAKDEEDAKAEFYKNWNNATYRNIEQVKIINTEDCIVEYQLGFEVFYDEKAACELIADSVELREKEQNHYSILVKRHDEEDMIFDKLYVHSNKDGGVALMICLADNRTNWVDGI